nr:DUF4397 domain-containing protein [Streptomyces finlayi]
MNLRTSAAVVSTSVCALALMTAPALAAENDRATVSVLHAVPGLTVDVFANGDELLPDFRPGTLSAPQSLPAGSYDLKVFRDGEGPRGTPAVQKKIDVPAGANATVVAHLSADGKPQLDAFVNDTAKVPAGKARLTVRHVAAAPPVDVRAAGTPVFKDLANPREASADVAPGTLKADVVLAGTDTVALGPADLKLEEGTSTVVYAWGSAADKNLALKVQSLKDLHSAPSGVHAGFGPDSGNDSRTWPGFAAGAALLGLAGVVAVRRSAARGRA